MAKIANLIFIDRGSTTGLLPFFASLSFSNNRTYLVVICKIYRSLAIRQTIWAYKPGMQFLGHCGVSDSISERILLTYFNAPVFDSKLRHSRHQKKRCSLNHSLCLHLSLWRLRKCMKSALLNQFASLLQITQ